MTHRRALEGSFTTVYRVRYVQSLQAKCIQGIHAIALI